MDAEHLAPLCPVCGTIGHGEVDCDQVQGRHKSQPRRDDVCWEDFAAMLRDEGGEA